MHRQLQTSSKGAAKGSTKGAVSVVKGAGKSISKGPVKNPAKGNVKSTGTAGQPSAPRPAGAHQVQAGGVAPPNSTASASSATAGAASRGLKLKRPNLPATPKVGGAQPAAPAATLLRAFTKKDEDHIGINTLVGEYLEKGTNHGRKFFQKQQKIPGHEEVKVFLYFWDDRDGPDFTGWWFGDQVGGSQVWSRAIDSGQTPPFEGWKIPWDGPVEKDLLLVEPTGVARQSQSWTPQASALIKTKSEVAEEAEPEEQEEVEEPADGELEQEEAKEELAAGEDEVKEEEDPAMPAANSIDIAADRVLSLESDVSEALERVRQLIADDVTEDSFKEATEICKHAQVSVSAAQKDLGQDVNKAKIARDSPAIVGLQKLNPRLRTLQVTIQSETQKLKAQHIQSQKKVADERKRSEESRKAKEIEQRDQQAYQEALPTAKEAVVQAEEAVETVEIMASSVSADLEEELRDDATSAMNDIEQSAKAAQDALGEARKVLSEQITTARRYAPEARKVALKEYSELQDKVTEAAKKLNPFLKFKKDYEEKVKAKKSMDEIATKLANAELEVEKAHIMSMTGAQEQMEDHDIKVAEELLTPAQVGITAAMDLIAKKSREPHGTALSFKAEFDKMQARAKQSRDKLDEVRVILRKQREGAEHKKMMNQVHEVVERAEDALQKTSEAEMPFFKGIEVLPSVEALEAISESESAASHADAAILQAKQFVKQKQEAVKKSTHSSKVLEELEEFLARVEEAGQKLFDFKKDTMKRKTQNTLQEVVEKVSVAENKTQSLGEVAKLFDVNLDETTTEKLQGTFQQAQVVEKEATEAVIEARLVLQKKLNEAKASIDLHKELMKLADRLTSVDTELRKHKKTTSGGERLIKSKQVLFDLEDNQLKHLETEVARVEQLAATSGDGRLSEEAIKDLDTAVKNCYNAMWACEKSINKHSSDAPGALKAALNKLLVRTKKSQEKISIVQRKVQEQREWLQADIFVKQAQEKTKEVETALDKVNDAELPFLKGIEVLPLEEAQGTVTQSEQAVDILTKAIAEARTYIASKQVEARKFVDKVSQFTDEEFSKCRTSINTAAQKNTQFKKDTESRRRLTLLQEADELLTSLEDELKKSIELAAPLCCEDPSTLSSDRAHEVCHTLNEMDKVATKKLHQAKQFLLDKQKDVRSHAASEEQMKAYHKRLSKIQVELQKAKSSASENEQKYVARRLMSEAKDWVKLCESEVDKASEAAAPLLDQDGLGFLLETQLVTVARATKDQLKKSSRSSDDLFEELSCGTGAIAKPAFLKYLEELPVKLERPDLSYTRDQREAMFNHADRLCQRNVPIDGTIKGDSEDKGSGVKSDAKTEVSKAEQMQEASKETKAEEVKAEDIKNEDVKTEDSKTEDVKPEGAKTEEAKPAEAGTLKANEKENDEKAKQEEEVKAEEVKLEEEAKAEQAKAEEVKKEHVESQAKKTDSPQVEEKKEVRDGMTLAAFKAMLGLSERFVCVQSVSVTDCFEIIKSKTVTKLEVDEVVENMTEPKLNEGGVTRVQCRLLKRDIVGWVTMRGNQGTLYLEPFSPYDSKVKATDRIRLASVKNAAKVAGMIKAKEADLFECTQGPLSQVRLDLNGLKPRVAKAQKTLEKLLISISRAKKKYEMKEKAAKQLQQTAKDQKAVAAILAEVKKKEAVLEASVQKLHEIATPILNVSVDGPEATDTPLTLSASAEKAAADVVKDYEDARACIETHKKVTESASRGPMLDAKQEIGKIHIKIENIQRKSRSYLEAVRGAMSALGAERLTRLIVVLRDQVVSREISFEALFSDIAEGKDQVSEEAFCKYINGLPDLNFPEEHCRLLAKHIDIEGRSARGFRVMLEQFFAVQKKIAVTNDFEISKSKTMRMLELGEIVEVLEGPRGDAKLGVERIRGRALIDGVSGWISVKGNQGTPFLKETRRPCYSCHCEVRLEKEFRSSSDDELVRILEAEEVVEVVEGPRKDKFDDALRIKAKACSDGTVGWLTSKTKDGVVNCEKAERYYVCTAAIAVTDVRDIKNCKVMRKLEVGEVVEVLEGPIDEPEASVTRVHCRSKKDGLQGWITIKGNAGTVYAEEATKHYTMLHGTPLQKVFSSEGEVIRQLAEGEAFEALEGPTPEKFDDVVRIKCRAVIDGSTGWVTNKATSSSTGSRPEANLRFYISRHQCTSSTVLNAALAAKSSAVIRKLEQGEFVEVLDGPLKDPELSMLRVRCCAESDGAVGWVTLKGSQGTLFLVPRAK